MNVHTYILYFDQLYEKIKTIPYDLLNLSKLYNISILSIVERFIKKKKMKKSVPFYPSRY